MQGIAKLIAGQTATDTIARLLFAVLFLLFGIGKFHVDDALELAGVVNAHPVLNIALEGLGPVGFANMLGVVEVFIGLLLLAGIMSARVALVGALMAVGTFLVTCSLILFVPVFREGAGFPFGNFTGLFLFKDLGLLACALLLLRTDAKRLLAE